MTPIRARGSHLIALLFASLLPAGCEGAVATEARESTTALQAQTPVVGGPCEGCELVFRGMPERLADRARIAPAGEPGEPMVLEGIVRRPDGSPADGVIVYAYQTDADGIYPRADTRHGRLRGWARTGADGAYRFDTIRPGSYPNTRNPQHIHLHVIEPGRATYWIDEVNFTDDPLLDVERERRSGRTLRGGPGIVDPEREPDGTWRVRRDIVLGEGVPGYERLAGDG